MSFFYWEVWGLRGVIWGFELKPATKTSGQLSPLFGNQFQKTICFTSVHVCSRDHLFSKECWFRLQGCRTCAVSNSVSFCTLVQRESSLDTHQKCYPTVIFSCPSYFAFFYEPWRVLKVSHRASEWCLRRALVDWRRSTRSKPTLKVVMRNFSQVFGIIWRAGTGPTNHTLQDSKRRSLAKFHP